MYPTDDPFGSGCRLRLAGHQNACHAWVTLERATTSPLIPTVQQTDKFG